MFTPWLLAPNWHFPAQFLGSGGRKFLSIPVHFRLWGPNSSFWLFGLSTRPEKEILGSFLGPFSSFILVQKFSWSTPLVKNAGQKTFLWYIQNCFLLSNLSPIFSQANLSQIRLWATPLGTRCPSHSWFHRYFFCFWAHKTYRLDLRHIALYLRACSFHLFCIMHRHVWSMYLETSTCFLSM